MFSPENTIDFKIGTFYSVYVLDGKLHYQSKNAVNCGEKLAYRDLTGHQPIDVEIVKSTRSVASNQQKVRLPIGIKACTEVNACM